MPNPRRVFTREFKADAVRRITEQDHGLAEVGRDLEIGEATLRRWKQAIAVGGQDAFLGKSNAPTLEEELHRFRSEVERLTMEREIPKKATAYFARESSSEMTSSRPTGDDGRSG